MVAWFKQLGTERVLLYNGEVHLFDISGKEKEVNTFLIPKYTTNTVKVNVISLLKSGDGALEIGALQNETFTRYSTSARYEEVLRGLMLQRNTVGYFNRSGNIEGVGYLQTVMVYSELTRLEPKLMQLGLSISKL